MFGKRESEFWWWFFTIFSIRRKIIRISWFVFLHFQRNGSIFMLLLCKVCVAIFVFISGYGVAASYRKQFGRDEPDGGEGTSFIGKRIWNVDAVLVCIFAYAFMSATGKKDHRGVWRGAQKYSRVSSAGCAGAVLSVRNTDIESDLVVHDTGVADHCWYSMDPPTVW